MPSLNKARYWYVSKLTIKILEEGFDLTGHLLALRRYHFMELADWADLFIMSLLHHVFKQLTSHFSVLCFQLFCLKKSWSDYVSFLTLKPEILRDRGRSESLRYSGVT